MRNLLPFALCSALLKAFLALGGDPLLLENLHFLGEVSVERAEEILA